MLSMILGIVVDHAGHRFAADAASAKAFAAIFFRP